ncbi:hypothetical protein C8R47DRAFT_1083598 [Mycena vitilis]|nr:hypothetical protein C8R47DRAFT_1083598 [Mycena vitilis]
MSFLYSGGLDDVYSSDDTLSLWALPSLDTTQSDSHAEPYYDPRDNVFSLNTEESFAAIASAATQDVVIGMSPSASKQPALTRLETHHALPTPNLLATRANGTVTAHRFEVDDSESEDEDDCDAQMDENDIHSNGEPLPPSPPIRDFDPDSSESSSEKGDDVHSQAEGSGEAYSAEGDVDANRKDDKVEDHVNAGGEGETGENQVDEDSDVDAVGYPDDDTDTGDADEEDSNDASVAVPRQQRLTICLPTRRRATQAPSPLASTSHSIAVGTSQRIDRQHEEELSDDDDEYAPPDVKRVRTNSGQAAGKKANGRTSERKRRTPPIELDPAVPKWEELDNGWWKCLWEETPPCGHLVKTRGGIKRHYEEKHLGMGYRQCPVCEVKLKTRMLDRHLNGDVTRSPTCKGPGGAKQSAKGLKTRKDGKAGKTGKAGKARKA